MTSLQCRRLTKLRPLRECNEMDFFDWLTVLFAFGVALYVMFDGGSNTEWPALMQPQGDDERRLG